MSHFLLKSSLSVQVSVIIGPTRIYTVMRVGPMIKFYTLPNEYIFRIFLSFKFATTTEIIANHWLFLILFQAEVVMIDFWSCSKRSKALSLSVGPTIWVGFGRLCLFINNRFLTDMHSIFCEWSKKEKLAVSSGSQQRGLVVDQELDDEALKI